MINSYQQFCFDSYKFNSSTGELELFYSIDDAYTFTEKYRFNFEFVDYNPEVLDRALQTLFFIAGVSYFKTFVPPEISVQSGQIDQPLAEFLNKTYQKGLGEFWYVNKLDPKTPVTFPINSPEILNTLSVDGNDPLVAIGGGKDSLVSIETLKITNGNLATWSLNHKPQLQPLVDRVALPHFWVDREWDPQLFDLKDNPEALNGHIPISAIFASVGVVVAILSGKRDVVMSNESSADEPTLSYQDVSINHQYSKSSEFEKDFQSHLQRNYGDGIRYYSLLRPLSELHISELFSRIAYPKYGDVFSSCNRAFTHGESKMFWCGECPKCAFIFLMFTPFIERTKLEALFGGNNLLLDPKLDTTYKSLLGIEGNKPLECVGEVKESRAAMRLSQKQYQELTKYRFELPIDYDWQALNRHTMPPKSFKSLQKILEP